MASKRSPIDRVLEFYREQSSDVVRVVHALASEIIAERGIGPRPNGKSPAAKRTYTKKSKPASGTSASGNAGVITGGANE